MIGDEEMRLKEWFGKNPGSIVVLRPDRFVAGLCFPVEVNELLAAVADKMGLQLDAASPRQEDPVLLGAAA